MLWQIVALASVSPSSLPGANSTTGLAGPDELKVVLGIVFGIIGALALLVIMISGLRYIASAGDPQKAAQARNGIIYALVGLAVALAAEAIVDFVIGKVSL